MQKAFEKIECSSSLERGVLLVHGSLLDAGYKLKVSFDVDGEGNVRQTVLPHSWKQLAPKYSFEYEEADMQALIVGKEAKIHVACKDKEVVSTELHEDEEASWPSKIKTHLINKLQPETSQSSAQETQTPQRDPGEDRQRSPAEIPLPSRPAPEQRFVPPTGRPFDPVTNPFGENPGMLVGPEDPRWAGRGGNGGMAPPRYDPIGPMGIGEPDDDHFRPPGNGRMPQYDPVGLGRRGGEREPPLGPMGIGDPDDIMGMGIGDPLFGGMGGGFGGKGGGKGPRGPFGGGGGGFGGGFGGGGFGGGGFGGFS